MTELILITISIILFIIMYFGVVNNFTERFPKFSIIITTLGYITTRYIGILVLFFYLKRNGPGDLNYFYKMAYSAKAGLIPYNNFFTPYSFLFSYLISLPLYIFDSKGSIVFLFAIFDTLLLYILYLINNHLKISDFPKLYWVYTFCPLMFISTIYWAQEEIILAFILTLSFLFIIKDKEFIASILLIAGLLITKFIIIYFYIPLLLFFKKKSYGILIFIAILLAHIILSLSGVNIMVPFHEGVYPPEGNNIWHLLRRVGLSVPNFISYSYLILIILLFLFNELKKTGPNHLSKFTSINFKLNYNNLLRIIMIFSLLFMSFSAKSYSPYFLTVIVFYLLFLFNGFSEHSHITSKKKRILQNSFLLYSLILANTIIADNYLRDIRGLGIITILSWTFILFTFCYQLYLLRNLLEFKGTDLPFTFK